MTAGNQNSLCNVAILAGGMGTRLASRTGNLPKTMVPLHGRPILEWQIECCRRHGFDRIALLVHHRHELIAAHFGNGEAFGVSLTYCIEEEPRGTAGALRDALPRLDEQFLVIYGDTYFDVDLERLWKAHRPTSAATLFLHPNDHPQDSDLVEMSPEGRVSRVHAYPHTDQLVVANLVNAALYVFRRELIAPVLPRIGKADLAKHSFPALLAGGAQLTGYVSPEYIKDLGTPERLDKVSSDLISGLPTRLSARVQRRAVFLDRDGTINEDSGHLRRPDDFRLIKGSGAAVRHLNRAGRLAIVVTNQPVVARGEATLDDLAAIHARMDRQLGEAGAYVDDLFFCPHHPDRGYPGEVSELKIACTCRKPGTELIDRAVVKHSVDRRTSWFVGDSTSDLRAGHMAGLRTVLVRSGAAGLDGKYPTRPNFVCHDLSEAVRWILSERDATARKLVPLLPALFGRRIAAIGGRPLAGKSSAACLLIELLAEFGQRAHLVPINALNASQISDLRDPARFYRIESPSPWALHGRKVIDVDKDDLVLLEAVDALIHPALANDDPRIYVECSVDLLQNRRKNDTEWRKQHQIPERTQIDEDHVVTTRNQATFILS